MNEGAAAGIGEEETAVPSHPALFGIEAGSSRPLLDDLPPDLARSGAAASGLLPLLAALCEGLRPRSILLVAPPDPTLAAFYRAAARHLGIPAILRIRAADAAADPAVADETVDLLHIGVGDAAPWRRVLTPSATLIQDGGPSAAGALSLALGDGIAIAGARALRLLATIGDAEQLTRRCRAQGRALTADAGARAADIAAVPDQDAAVGRKAQPRTGRISRLVELLWHSRRRAATLRPIQNLEALDAQGLFRTTGPEPLLALDFAEDRPATGWAIAEVLISDADAPLYPSLMADAADGGRSAYYFSTRAGRSSRLVRLPDDTTALSFSPSNQPRRFRLGPMAIQEMGILQILASALRRDPGAVWRSLVHLVRRETPAAKLAIVRCFATDQEESYAGWITLFDATTPFDRAAIAGRIASLPARPLFTLFLWLDGPLGAADRAAARETIGSVTAQLYPEWELLLIGSPALCGPLRDEAEAAAAGDPRIRLLRQADWSAVADAAAGHFCGSVAAGDRLAETALFCAADRLDAEPDLDILYTDEDCLDGAGRRHAPFFKTAWDEERFLAQDYLTRLGLFRTALVRAAGGLDAAFGDGALHDLALRLVERTSASRIVHLPYIGYHRRSDDGAPPATGNAARRAIAAALGRRGEGAVISAGRLAAWPRIRWPMPDPAPPVTLIVPTRDRVGLLKTCLDGLLNRTGYGDLDVIIVDNDSREAETLAYFEEIVVHPRVSLLKVPGPFNFSALNNRAVERARGDYVGFINNDIDIVEPGWLAEMMSHAVRPGVGAVGAKLLYADGRVQHAGVGLGIGGIAGHTERFAPGDAPGYGGDLMLTRNVSCVTAACQIMSKRIFAEVGGFDETLTVALNDVELCVRLVAAGYRIVLTPYATLLHLESVSRGTDLAPEKARRFRQERAYVERRWGTFLRNDAFYSPNLSIMAEDMALAFPPRLRRPWLLPRRG